MLHEVMINDGGAEDLVFMDPSVIRPLTLALIKMDTSGVVLGTLATAVSTEFMLLSFVFTQLCEVAQCYSHHEHDRQYTSKHYYQDL